MIITWAESNLLGKSEIWGLEGYIGSSIEIIKLQYHMLDVKTSKDLTQELYFTQYFTQSLNIEKKTVLLHD